MITRLALRIVRLINVEYFSQAIRAGQTLYISGQLGLVPGSGEFKAGDVPVRAQSEQAMQNMGAILKAAGASFDNGPVFCKKMLIQWQNAVIDRTKTWQFHKNEYSLLRKYSYKFKHLACSIFHHFFFAVVKTTILLVDMAHFPVVNDVYKGFFNESQGYPARACYQVRNARK